jgi:hypothetical protein
MISPISLPRISGNRKPQKSLLTLVFLFSVHMAFPQQQVSESRSSQSRLLSSIPFTTFTGGVVVIRAQLAGFTDSLNFILDTGSEGVSIDSGTCSRMKIKTEPSDRLSQGIAGIRQVCFVRNRGLIVGGISIDSLDFHINDLSRISNVFGDNIDGIMGIGFLSRFISYIDYDNNRLYLYSKGEFKYPRQGFLLRPSISRIPVQPAKIRESRDISSRFYFDIGAGLCLLLSSDFTMDSSLFPANKKVVLTEAEGMGGKKDMRLTTIREFRLGPYKFRHVPVYVFDDEYNIITYPNLTGLIGNDLLRRFNTWLNFGEKEIYLVPNTHFNDPFDYSYTGMSIFWIDGQIKIGDIIKGSPAEKAGFRTDDIVISVDNNSSGNLKIYKELLQNIGEKIHILVRRPGGLHEIALKVDSIL